MKRMLCFLLVLALSLCAPCALAKGRSAEACTDLAGVSPEGVNNIELAASAISGMSIAYGERFSFNETVGPRSSRYGFEEAEDGRGIPVTGGGAEQCAAALYLALEALDADLDYTELHFYGDAFAQDYVSSGSKAVAVEHDGGLDFSFINYEEDMYIGLEIRGDALCCRVELEGRARKSASGSHSPVSSASIWLDGSEELYSNVLHAASSVNDTMLEEGDLFSFNDVVGPRSERYDYVPAVNGRGDEVIGGGVDQVASVIWLAVKKLDGASVVEKTTYGSRYNQEYVSSSGDAILVDEEAGTDFSFRNTGEGALLISTGVRGDQLYCEIYRF